MKLNQLQLFQAACNAGNITHAAELMNISQPSVTTAIQALEDEFGVKLINRTTKGISLTEEGVVFLSYTETILNDATRMVNAMKAIKEEKCILRIGIPSMVGVALLVRIQKGFSEKYPDIQLQITEDTPVRLLKMMRNNELDVCIAQSDRISGSDLITNVISELEIMFCTNRNNHFAKKKSIKYEEFRDEAVVLSSHHQFIEDVISSRGGCISIVNKTSQIQTIYNYISNNIASGFLYKGIEESLPDIVSVPLDPPIKRHISLSYLRDKNVHSNMRKFIDYLEGGLWKS